MTTDFCLTYVVPEKDLRTERFPLNHTLIAEDYIVPPGVSKEQLTFLEENFVPQKKDLWICSYPKSGNTWVRQIVYLLRHENQKYFLSQDSCQFERQNQAEFLTSQKEKSGIGRGLVAENRVYKTHLQPAYLPKNLLGKLIYIYRDPKDVSVSSYFYYTKKLEYNYQLDISDHIQNFAEGRFVYGAWKEHLLNWAKWCKNSDLPILVLRYEEMLQNPTQAVIQIADFLGLSLTPERIAKVVEDSSFQAMSSNPLCNLSERKNCFSSDFVSFFRSGVAGDWQKHFQANHLEQYDALVEDIFAKTGDFFKFT
eukprot:TRINITY_DN1905_c0_g3_i2.p1 TRINITY_DN1905_c0_g3~~TRINITY_DN1905_c0_g3_i2.p1  ORF type:complete len:310 (-),score=64.86 TRINITY_DN1905_c0_g3_i2:37-966(-)